MCFVLAVYAADDLESVKMAAGQGDANAQFDLGIMYSKGEGIPENDVKAYVWFSIAAAQNNQSARKMKEMIAKRMTRSQIARVQNLSREYWEAYGPTR